MGNYPSGFGIIPYDRTLLKSVPIKGPAREARTAGEGLHTSEPIQATAAAYFRGQAISLTA